MNTDCVPQVCFISRRTCSLLAFVHAEPCNQPSPLGEARTRHKAPMSQPQAATEPNRQKTSMCCYVNLVNKCVDFKGAFVEYNNILREGWSPRDLWSDITREISHLATVYGHNVFYMGGHALVVNDHG